MFNTFGRNVINENLLVLNFPYEIFELLDPFARFHKYYSYMFSWASYALDR